MARQPFLHLVGDRFGRADKRKPTIAADALGELAHGELVARGEVYHALAAALAGVGFRNRRQRPVRIEAGRIGAEDAESEAMALS